MLSSSRSPWPAAVSYLCCLLVAGVLFPWLALAQQNTSSSSTPPSSPGLTYLYHLNCSLGDSIEIGQGPKGYRVAIPIIGGTFSGPRLSGTVSNLGADWGLVDNATSVFSADTRYNLVTDDGANIFIQTSGPTQPDGPLHLRILFETGHPAYYWLNNIVAVGILRPWDDGPGIAIDAWQLESPAS